MCILTCGATGTGVSRLVSQGVRGWQIGIRVRRSLLPGSLGIEKSVAAIEDGNDILRLGAGDVDRRASLSSSDTRGRDLNIDGLVASVFGINLCLQEFDGNRDRYRSNCCAV